LHEQNAQVAIAPFRYLTEDGAVASRDWVATNFIVGRWTAPAIARVAEIVFCPFEKCPRDYF
jgi:hypothetical protein